MSQYRTSNARPEQTIEGAAQDKFIIQQLIANISTIELVKIISVTVPTNDLAAIGRCSIQPLVMQIDGDNTTYPRGIIENVPYLRIQGGKNAVVLDPVVGDVGLAGFCSRDISMVKRTGEEAAPNTRRQYDINDAVYFFTWNADAPQQYIHFKENEIRIKADSKIVLDAPLVEATGNIVAAQDVKAGSISLKTHKHGNVQSGQSDTGAPK